MEESLTAKIKVLEGNYSFLKKEHGLLLKGLHEEIEKLQRKYSELAFDYTIRSNKSLEIVLLEDKINQLQSSLTEKNEEVKSQKEKLNLEHLRHQEKETKLMQQIEDQKNAIENLQGIISQQKNVNKDQSEKEEKPKKETQTEKAHRRKKRKSASFHACETGNSSILTPEKSSNKDLKSKVLPTKSTKSASVPSSTSPLVQSIQYPASESENNQKKGKRDRRNRKKNNTPVYMGDVPILPPDYRAVVATLPPISQTQEESNLANDMHKFVPCSSGRHTGFSALKSDVSPLSQLHKGLRKPPLKVESFN